MPYHTGKGAHSKGMKKKKKNKKMKMKKKKVDGFSKIYQKIYNKVK